LLEIRDRFSRVGEGMINVEGKEEGRKKPWQVVYPLVY
jgi:hypothetical protein